MNILKNEYIKLYAHALGISFNDFYIIRMKLFAKLRNTCTRQFFSDQDWLSFKRLRGYIIRRKFDIIPTNAKIYMYQYFVAIL